MYKKSSVFMGVESSTEAAILTNLRLRVRVCCYLIQKSRQRIRNCIRLFFHVSSVVDLELCRCVLTSFASNGSDSVLGFLGPSIR